MTNDSWINLYTAKILGFADLNTYGFEAMRSEIRQSQTDLWGSGGTLGATKAALTVSSGEIVLSADVNGWSGSGYRMSLDASDAAFTGAVFANSGATVYSVGAKPAPDVPAAVELGADGSVNYSRHVELVGEVVTPSSVIDNGDGTVTLVIAATGGLGAWGTATDTRVARAWLVSPATTGADAIYDGTAAYDAGNTRIEVSPGHQFGQTSPPSTTAADYRVLVEGLSVTVEATTDLSADAAYWYLGTVTSGSHSDTDQNLLESFGDTVAAFAAEHSTADGKHTTITFAEKTDLHAIYTADDVQAYGHTFEIITGTPTVVYENFDQGLDFAQIYLDLAVTGEGWFHLPLRLPSNFVVTHFRSFALRASGAAVECRIVRALFSTSTAARTVLGTHAHADTSGAWVVSAKTAVSEYQLPQTDADRLELQVYLKNDGSSNGSARFGGFILYGKASTIAHGGWATKT